MKRLFTALFGKSTLTAEEVRQRLAKRNAIRIEQTVWKAY